MEASEIRERLKGKVDELFESTRQFQIALEEAAAPGTKGTSYASVYDYVEGRAKGAPPIEFLNAAAKVLNVRPAWLAFGDEPESPTAAAAERSDDPIIAAATIIPALTFGGGRELLVTLVHQLVGAQPADAPDVTDADLASAVQAIELTVFGMLMALSGPGQGRPATGMVQSVMGMLVAMLAAVPPARSGRPLRDVVELLPRSKDFMSKAKLRAQSKAKKKGGR